MTVAIAWFIWALFVNTRYASVFGLCNAITSKTSRLGLPWAAVDPLVVALPLSAIIMCGMQLHYQREEKGLAVNTA